MKQAPRMPEACRDDLTMVGIISFSGCNQLKQEVSCCNYLQVMVYIYLILYIDIVMVCIFGK